ncbi:MAG: hypothetical protein K2X66_09510, partial [Cyanobacteria bacterium]|nr:hypothetical protein [Cyanobacteriota bacterium]
MIFKGLTPHEIKGLSLFLLIIFCIFLQGINGNTAGFYFDDGMYLIGSRGLAAGYGYVISNFLEFAPIIKYPPLFSILMSPFWWVLPHYPDNLLLLKLFNILISVSYIGALYLCFRKILDYSCKLSFLLISFIAMDYTLTTVTTEIMSEPLYLLISLLTFISFQLYFNQSNGSPPETNQSQEKQFTKKFFFLT